MYWHDLRQQHMAVYVSSLHDMAVLATEGRQAEPMQKYCTGPAQAECVSTKSAQGLQAEIATTTAADAARAVQLNPEPCMS